VRLGAGVIASGLAWLLERIARLTSRSGSTTTLSKDLAPLALPAGGLVQDVAVATRERLHERGDVGLVPERQGRQLQPDRPPFCASRHGRHGRVGQGQIGSDRFAQQGRCLFRGEAQAGGA
jgi:hypothetical protein